MDPAAVRPVIYGVSVSLREPNDILKRFDEDFAQLASLGVGQIRLAFDWAALQPRAGGLDDEWCERYHVIVSSARAHGLGVVAGLRDGATPGWFEDEGGFGDQKAAGRWWPRWVEAAAATFGDHLAGFIPLADPVGAVAAWAADSRRHVEALRNVAVAWRDAWHILEGGPPVGTDLALRVVMPADNSLEAIQAARWDDRLQWRMWLRAWRDGVMTLPDDSQIRVEGLAGTLDVLGWSTGCDLPGNLAAGRDAMHRWTDDLSGMLRRVAEEGPERPMALTLRASAVDDDQRRDLMEVSVRGLTEAVQDGIPLHMAILDPAVDTGRTPRRAGLLDRDREVPASSSVWLGRASSV